MLSRKILLAMGVIVLLVLLGGCTDNSLSSQTTPLDVIKNTQQPGGSTSSQNDPSAVLSQEKMILTVYHATKDGMYLAPEIHVVAKNDHPAQTALELLVGGTKSTELVSVIPQGTKLQHISVKDNIAYVDFNDKLVKNNLGGSASEILLVAAIVDTLTEFHNIQKVQIMVEGKKIDTISGHMDTSEPLGRSEKMIKK